MTEEAFNTTHSGDYDCFVFQHSELVKPVLNSPQDMTIDEGEAGSEIVWTVSDLNPDEYMIDGNGPTLGWTSWSGNSISYPLSELTPGVYEFTITVEDVYGNDAEDTVEITVIDALGPVFDSIGNKPVFVGTDIPVVVAAIVTDVTSDVETVKLLYRVHDAEGDWENWINTTMTTSGNDNYTATIPGQSFGASIEYKIWAEDSLHNENTSSTSSYEVTLGEPRDLIQDFILAGEVIGALGAIAGVLVLVRRKISRSGSPEGVGEV